MKFGRPLLLSLVLLILLSGCASPRNAPRDASGQPSPAVPASLQLQVELVAPNSVRGVLQRYLRVMNRTDLQRPRTRADRRALVRRTREEAAELLATEGYFKPEIGLDRIDDGHWRLTVEPGTRARITAVSLDFLGDLGKDGSGNDSRRLQLRKNWQLQPGAAFRQADWDQAKQTLLDDIASRAYASARITDSRAEVDAEAAIVRLHVTVDSGPPFYLGELEVSGIEQLPPDFVEHFNTLEKGDLFDQDKLLAFQTALQNAPQFASVVVDIDRDPAVADAAPIRVQIVEAKSRHLAFGAGVSSNTGARTEFNWRNVNLFSRGLELSTGLRLEQRRQTAYADIFMPPDGGERDSFGVMSEASDIENLETQTYAIGGTRTRVRGDIETAISLRYQHENLRPQGAEETQHNALSLNWSWLQRKVDNVLDPRSGYVLHVQFGGGSKALLSDQDFFRSYGRFVYYLPVRERDVFIMRAEGGATIAKSRDGIPQDFLFRTGGAQTVRGYKYNSLGVEDGRATVGGRYMTAVSAEYVNWFKPKWGVAAFFDAGNANDDRDTFKLKTGYGLGGRWRSPAGPIALDLAYGHDDQRFRLHFSVAIAF